MRTSIHSQHLRPQNQPPYKYIDRERERECVCKRKRERGCVRECASVTERECVCLREREREEKRKEEIERE